MFGIGAMFETAILEGLFKLSLALLGLILARLLLIWMDRNLVSNQFREWLEKANDQARATYYSGRLIAVCLLVGLALS